MPSGQRDIVLGGGIAAAAPFTIGTLPQVSVTSPPTVVDSVFRQAGTSLADGRQILIGSGQAVSPVTTLDAILIGRNSVLSNGWGNMVAIGPAITLGEENGIAIGSVINIASANGSGNSIAIGRNIDISTQGAGPQSLNIIIGTVYSRLAGDANRNVVAIGHSINVGGNGTGTNNLNIIGNGITFSGTAAGNSVIIGHGAGWQGTQSVGIGVGTVTPNGSVVIGQAANAGNTGADNVVIGRAAGGINNRSFCIAIGQGASMNGGNNNVVIGTGASATAANGIAIGSGAIAGANECAIGGAATGILLVTFQPGVGNPIALRNAQAQPIIFRNSANAVDTLTINDNGIVSIINTLSLIQNAANVEIQLRNLGVNGRDFRLRSDNAGNFKLVDTTGAQTWATFSTTQVLLQPGGNSVSAVPATTTLVVGTTLATCIGIQTTNGTLLRGYRAGDTFARVNLTDLNLSFGSGSAIADVSWQRSSAGLSLMTGIVEFQTDRGLQFATQTDQAGVQAGTLANAPAVGNPAFWLPIKVNGIIRSVPCW